MIYKALFKPTDDSELTLCPICGGDGFVDQIKPEPYNAGVREYDCPSCCTTGNDVVPWSELFKKGELID